ncbi:hypothetical protein PHJA_000876700 [Phtheirospermum japonicum]|uniref:Uncharacterized protein n=1 Tax=Phtheirospermum japonicum TaxID=374723 RepID=A0A830BIB5_9LAMI|nr:hypothetical protein PHJA_000876700 [Phtheirospermum japonicum]
MLGKPGDGINGVKFKLTAKKQKEDPHFYFACGEDNGGHCSTGKMRFSVYPVPRY